MNLSEQEMHQRFFPDGKPLPYQHLFQFPPTNNNEQMDQQPPKRKRENSPLGKEASSSSSSKSKKTSTSGETPFVIDASNFTEYLKTVPVPPPRPLPQRRSPRLNKFNGRYGLSLPREPPLPRELRRYLMPPRGTVTERERQEVMEMMKSAPTLSSPYDGFGFSAEEIAALERGDLVNKYVEEYVEEGLNREAAEIAVKVYLNNSTKVKKFVDAFTSLRGMGFPKNQVVRALITYDGDVDQALAYLNK